MNMMVGLKEKIFKFSTDLTNAHILESQVSLYKNVKNVSKKLNILIKTGRGYRNLAALNIWARNKPEEIHRVITFSAGDVFNTGYEKNIKISTFIFF